MAGENCTSQEQDNAAMGSEEPSLASIHEALFCACSQFHELRNLALAAKALVQQMDGVQSSDEGMAAMHICELLGKRARDCAAQTDEAWLMCGQLTHDPAVIAGLAAPELEIG